MINIQHIMLYECNYMKFTLNCIYSIITKDTFLYNLHFNCNQSKRVYICTFYLFEFDTEIYNQVIDLFILK